MKNRSQVEPGLLRALACTVCGGVLRSTAAGLLCEACGHEFQVVQGIPVMFSAPPSSSQLADIFDEQVSQVGDSPLAFYPSSIGMINRLRTRNATLRRRALADHLGTYKEARILDVGCATGNYVDLTNPGNEFLGIDISLGMLHLAREKGMHVAQGSISDRPFRPAQFDVALCLEVLPYFESGVELLRILYDLLVPGGELILSSAVNSWARKPSQVTFWLLQKVGLAGQKRIARLYPVQEIEAILYQAGFFIRCARSIFFPFTCGPWSATVTPTQRYWATSIIFVACRDE